MGRSKLVVILALAVVLVVVCAGPAAAAGDSPNIFAPALDLGIWTLVIFLLLLLVLGKFAWKPMLEGLQKREANIRNAIEEAERTRAEAQRLRDELQQKANQAHEKVRDILDEARRDAAHTTEEMVAKARADILADRDRLRREIETAKDQALQELWAQSAQLATLMSTKAIRRELSLDDHRRLVDEAIAELRSEGTEWQRQAGRKWT